MSFSAQKEPSRSAFLRGAKMALPIVLGYFPLATAYGILAYQVGLSVMETTAMSLLVYAGASQFMAVNMLSLGAAGVEIVLACFMVNIRHIVMSMALLQRYRHIFPFGRRWAALGTTDETFALLSFAPIRHGKGSDGYFLAGVMLTAYLSWVSGSFFGSFLSANVPAIGSTSSAASMGMALYAMFIGLLVPGLKRQPAMVPTALAGAGICTAFTPVWGSGWAIALGTLGGGFVGMIRSQRSREDDLQ